MKPIFVLIAFLSCLTPGICGPNAVVGAMEEFKSLFDPLLAKRDSHSRGDPEIARDEKRLEICLKNMEGTARILPALNLHANHHRDEPAVIEEDEQTSLRMLESIEKSVSDVIHSFPRANLDVSARTAAAAAHKLLVETRAYREELMRGEFPKNERPPATNVGKEPAPNSKP